MTEAALATVPVLSGELHQLQAYAERKAGPPGRRTCTHIVDRAQYLERQADDLRKERQQQEAVIQFQTDLLARLEGVIDELMTTVAASEMTVSVLEGKLARADERIAELTASAAAADTRDQATTAPRYLTCGWELAGIFTACASFVAGSLLSPWLPVIGHNG